MKLKPYLIFIVLILSLFPNITGITGYEKQEIVYINDENVYIAVYPHTTSGGYIYINFTSRTIDNELDFLLGFNGSKNYPSMVEIYNPVQKSYIDREPIIEKNITVEWKNTTIYYWVNWTRLLRSKNQWINIKQKHNDMDNWFSFRLPIIKNKQYHIRIMLHVTPNINSVDNEKFWIAVKPVGVSLSDSISNKMFYALDPWLNTSWSYRKQINISQSVGAGVKYHLNLTVNYINGSDSGYNIYCNESCQTDFDDLRFTEDDGETLLDYWIADYEQIDSNRTEVYIEISDNLSASSVSIYMYYGNAGASYIGNGFDTFLFFDDFEDSDVTDWTKEAQVILTSEAIVIYERTRSMKIKTSTAWKDAYKSQMISNSSLINQKIVYASRRSSSGTSSRWGVSNITGHVLNGFNTYFRNTAKIEIWNGSWYALTNYVANTWYEFQFNMNFSTSEYEIWLDDSIIKPWGGSRYTMEGTTMYYIYENGAVGISDYQDSIYNLKYVDPQPTLTYGNEENAPIVRDINWLGIAVLFMIAFMSILIMYVADSKR